MDQIKQGIAVVARAVEQDKNNNLQTALDLYRQAISLFQSGLTELEPPSRTRATTEAKLKEYETRRDQIITILQRQQAVAPASTLRPTRSAGADGEPALVRKRSLSNGSANKMLQMSVVAAPAAVDSDDVLIDAKRILNDAMNADRAKQYETALALYENGLDELMRLIKVSNDQQQRQWITEQIRRHLTRAETVKKLIVEEKERRAPLTGVRALEIADIAWDEGRYEQALGHYEKALALLRQTPPTDATSDQLVHCSERIELLNARATHGGRFERPIPLGHRPGEKYVDPVIAPTKWEKFKDKTIKVTKKVANKVDDLLKDDDEF